MLIRLGEIIQDAREYKEITRANVAEYVGVSEEIIKEFEENRTVPEFDNASLIFHFFDTKMDWDRLWGLATLHRYILLAYC